MANLPIGTVVLVLVSLLVYFGLAHRVLDRMRLTDKGALAVLAAMIVFSYVTVPLARGRVGAEINLGGAVIPLALCVYLLVRAGTTKERVRTLGAAVVTAVAVGYTGRFIGGAEPETMRIDPLYFYPLAGGLVAYVVSRSRRAAFVSGVLGLFLYDLALLIWYAASGLTGFVSFGGAGTMDTYLVAGFLATALAEVVGEVRERLQGGPAVRDRPRELLNGLRKPEFANMLGSKPELQPKRDSGEDGPKKDGADDGRK